MIFRATGIVVLLSLLPGSIQNDCYKYNRECKVLGHLHTNYTVRQHSKAFQMCKDEGFDGLLTFPENLTDKEFKDLRVSLDPGGPKSGGDWFYWLGYTLLNPEVAKGRERVWQNDFNCQLLQPDVGYLKGQGYYTRSPQHCVATSAGAEDKDLLEDKECEGELFVPVCEKRTDSDRQAASPKKRPKACPDDQFNDVLATSAPVLRNGCDNTKCYPKTSHSPPVNTTVEYKLLGYGSADDYVQACKDAGMYPISGLCLKAAAEQGSSFSEIVKSLLVNDPPVLDIWTDYILEVGGKIKVKSAEVGSCGNDTSNLDTTGLKDPASRSGPVTLVYKVETGKLGTQQAGNENGMMICMSRQCGQCPHR